MKNLYKDVYKLDQKLLEKYFISEDVMQENACAKMDKIIRKKLKKHSSILIAVGSGNNGADGLALARRLHKDYKIKVMPIKEPKSPMAKLQYKRAKSVGVKFTNKITNPKLIVDAIFGSGLNCEIKSDVGEIINELNQKPALKLACDLPSGLFNNGNISKTTFKADFTVCMGALKSALFSDLAKDFVGKIYLANLGVSSKLYKEKSDTFLLEKTDLFLPIRTKQNTNKGNFGHLCVISGEKKGASLISAKAAFAFGAGLVTLKEAKKAPEFIMRSESLPCNTSAIACGMGLGKLKQKDKILLKDAKVPLLLDADILHEEFIKELLKSKNNIILTPHVKEFAALCKNLNIGNFTIEQILADKLALAREFSKKFNCVLVLKGANSIIAKDGLCFISPFGSPSLAKGGSGDVLSGLIASLLAQGYMPLYAAISGVLAHGLSINKFNKNNYALRPKDIIKGVEIL